MDGTARLLETAIGDIQFTRIAGLKIEPPPECWYSKHTPNRLVFDAITATASPTRGPVVCAHELEHPWKMMKPTGRIMTINWEGAPVRHRLGIRLRTFDNIVQAMRFRNLLRVRCEHEHSNWFWSMPYWNPSDFWYPTMVAVPTTLPRVADRFLDWHEQN